MRPLRLAMTAFGPYAGTEEVDFEALGDLGLFVVAGANGTGKTTIFDALYFALYGALPGRRRQYGNIRSDHADARTECRVELDFVAAGRRWRVERTPKQARAKQRGTGVTEVKPSAALLRFEGDRAETVVNRINEVNDECRRLVGLTGAQFERVALLPQGEFSRLLRESGRDRRELLRTLFASDVFAEATDLLVSRATESQAADRAETEHLDRELEAISRELATRSGTAPDPTSAGLHAELERRRGTELAALEQTAADLQREVDRLHAEHQHAVELTARVERKRVLDREIEQHLATQADYERDVGRLAAARAAIPVMNAATTLADHRAHHDRAVDECERGRVRADQMLVELGFDESDRLAEPPAAIERLRGRAVRLHDRLDMRRALDELDGELAQLEAERRRCDHAQQSVLERLDALATLQRQTDAQRDQLARSPSVEARRAELSSLAILVERRAELDQVIGRASELDGQCAELRATCSRLEAERDRAIDAQRQLAAAVETDHAATERLAAAEALRDASGQFHRLVEQLAARRHDAEHATRLATEVWDAFVLGTASRLASTLGAGEPCPVCGSIEHPQPARSDDTMSAVSETEVDRTRQAVDQATVRLAELQTRIEQLRHDHPEVTEVDAAAIAERIEAATAAALAARAHADRCRAEAAALDRVAQTLDPARRELADAASELSELVARRNQLIGALAEAVDESPERLLARAHEARGQLKQAERGAQRLADLQAELETLETGRHDLEQSRALADQQIAAVTSRIDDRRAQRASLLDDLGPAADDRNAQALEAEIEGVRRAEHHLRRLEQHRATEVATLDAVRRGEALLAQRVDQSPFDTIDDAEQAFVESNVVELLEAATADWKADEQRLRGQLIELGEVPDRSPDAEAAGQLVDAQRRRHAETTRTLAELRSLLDRLGARLAEHDRRRGELADDVDRLRLERVAGLVRGENRQNTSLENWVLAAHLRSVVELANLRLARTTQRRFQLQVLESGESRRGTWGIDIGIEDTVTGTSRPAAGLSGGELFQASLALALGLADAVMNQRAGVEIDALFIDEGFGSLDDQSVERAIDLLDELRGRGAMVGVITHVPALLDALPEAITVVPRADGQGSTIRQPRRAA